MCPMNLNGHKELQLCNSDAATNIIFWTLIISVGNLDHPPIVPAMLCPPLVLSKVTAGNIHWCLDRTCQRSSACASEREGGGETESNVPEACVQTR